VAESWIQRLGAAFAPVPPPGAPVVVVALSPDDARNARKWLLAAGILALIGGTVSIVVPAIASVGIAIFVGVVLMAMGVVMAMSAWPQRSRKRRALRFVEAALALVAGFCLVAFPLTGTLTLTVFLAAWFLATGVLLGAAAYEQRGLPGFGWTALHAVVSLILGLLIALELPSSAAWAIGLLVGVNLVFFGVRALVAARELKEVAVAAGAGQRG
jgi:uncharacterized membrane protein HdeD (DUF308 family)